MGHDGPSWEIVQGSVSFDARLGYFPNPKTFKAYPRFGASGSGCMALRA